MTKVDERFEQITATIVKSIKEGIADPKGWKAPWNGAGFIPKNATTNVQYRGGNVLSLWFAQEDKGYSTALWATYKQWAGADCQVRKGEKGTQCVKWVVKDKDANDPTSRKSVFPSVFTVFNADQVDGYEFPAPQAPLDRDAAADAFFEAVGAEVHYAALNSAAYVPVLDKITMPNPDQFTSTDGFYATLAHEHTHWTGAPARLDRNLKNRFGTQAYAAEELVAELGAAFLSAHLGVTAETRPDHAQYLANWLEVLSNDPKALYAAAGKAQQAVDFLIAEAAGAASAQEEVA